MAENWNKLKDKIGADAQGPTPADWEAMQAKIDAQPSLRPAVASKLWVNWLVAGSLGILLGIAVVYFWPNASGEQGLEVNDAQAMPALSKGDEEASEVAAKRKRENVAFEENSTSSTEHSVNQNEIQATEIRELNLNQSVTTVNVVDQEEDIAANREQNQEITRAEPEVNGFKAFPNQDFSSGATPEITEEGSDFAAANASQELASPSASNMEAETEADDNPSGESLMANADLPSIDSSAGQTKAFRAEQQDSSEAAVIENAEGAANAAFIPPSTGFKLERANLLLGLNHDLQSPATSAYGFGLELQWQKKAQFFIAGIGYYRIEQGLRFESLAQTTRLDSTWKEEIGTKEIKEVSRIWVIDSFQAGHYVYDTTLRIVADTNIILNVDTNQYQTKIVNQTVRPYYYAELPLLYGYQFGRGPWQFQVAGGLALQQAIAYSNDEDGSRSLFGMSALMQPALAWRFSDRWSALARVQLRYPLKQDVALYEEPAFRYSFQLGVSFRW